MTKTQIKEEMHKRMPEYFDAYFLIGKVAGQTSLVAAVGPMDQSTLREIRDGMARSIIRMDQELKNGFV